MARKPTGKRQSHRKLSPPTAAGPLMTDLEGHFLLQQLFCPSCKTLLDSEIVEAARLTPHRQTVTVPEPPNPSVGDTFFILSIV